MKRFITMRTALITVSILLVIAVACLVILLLSRLDKDVEQNTCAVNTYGIIASYRART